MLYIAAMLRESDSRGLDVCATVAGDGNDHRIPAAVAARARCVAVVPALVHGALFVGAKRTPSAADAFLSRVRVAF